MFKIMKHCKYGQPKSNHYSDKFYVNSAAGSDVVQIGDWRCDTNIKKTGKGLLFTEVPFRIEQGSLTKEAQNCFKKNTERRLVFWPLVARPGVGAQFYSCRQGLAWIELLSCNPDPGTKGESTRASWSTCLNMGQREKGALKTASRTSTVVSWLRLCTFIVDSWHIDEETMETVTDFIFWAPKSLQMVTAATKLKVMCSLEEKLWQT